MQLRSLFLSAAISSLIAGCSTNTPLVERLQYGPAGFEQWSGEGIVYTLPKTQIDLRFEVSKTVLADPRCDASDLSKEQQEAMGINPDNVGTGERELFALLSTELTARAVPDPTRTFVARFPKPSFFSDSSLLINMAEGGVVEGIEGSATDKTLAIAAKLLEVGGTIGASVVALGAGADSTAELADECANKAKEYIDLRNEIAGFRAGGSPHPKDSLDHYIAEIKAEQASIIAMFIGVPTVKKGAVVCSLAPSKAEQSDVLTLYPAKGFASSDRAVCRMDDIFTADGTNDTDKKFVMKLNVEVADHTVLNANKARSEAVPNAAGFFYAVPVRAFVSLGGHTKATVDRQSHLLPQLGEVHALPQAKGSSPTMVVTLHPATGALKSVKVANTASDIAAAVASAGTGTTNLLNAIATSRTKELESADPLTALTREKSLLEAELAIAVAKESLEQYHE